MKQIFTSFLVCMLVSKAVSRYVSAIVLLQIVCSIVAQTPFVSAQETESGAQVTETSSGTAVAGSESGDTQTGAVTASQSTVSTGDATASGAIRMSEFSQSGAEIVLETGSISILVESGSLAQSGSVTDSGALIDATEPLETATGTLEVDATHPVLSLSDGTILSQTPSATAQVVLKTDEILAKNMPRIILQTAKDVSAPVQWGKLLKVFTPEIVHPAMIPLEIRTLGPNETVIVERVHPKTHIFEVVATAQQAGFVTVLVDESTQYIVRTVEDVVKRGDRGAIPVSEQKGSGVSIYFGTGVSILNDEADVLLPPTQIQDVSTTSALLTSEHSIPDALLVSAGLPGKSIRFSSGVTVQADLNGKTCPTDIRVWSDTISDWVFDPEVQVAGCHEGMVDFTTTHFSLFALSTGNPAVVGTPLAFMGIGIEWQRVVGSGVSFIALTHGGSGAVTLDVDFGDSASGTFSQGFVTHTYDISGTYNYRITARDTVSQLTLTGTVFIGDEVCPTMPSYIFSELIGWIKNCSVSHTTDDSRLWGFLYSEQVGWIALSSKSYEQTLRTDVSTVYPKNIGVQMVQSGSRLLLQGYAFSEEVGYIYFGPVAGNTTMQPDELPWVDMVTGQIHGFAWSEETGYWSLSSLNHPKATPDAPEYDFRVIFGDVAENDGQVTVADLAAFAHARTRSGGTVTDSVWNTLLDIYRQKQ